jgi:3-dehydroquinate synthase
LKQAAEVRTAAGACPIYIEPGSLAQVERLLSEHDVGRTVLVVGDSSVAEPWVESVAGTLRRSFEVEVALAGPGEAAKSWAGAEPLFDRLVEMRAERRDTVVAVGGGVVGDLAGFVAAIYLRGINLVQVPTSLLAMADAAIGGKTAINHPRGKNLIGAFHQPLFVLEDPEVLATMPERAFREGWAEVIKHGLIADLALLAFLEDHVAELQTRDVESLTRTLIASARVKAEIVSGDEREEGRRMWLNYGHTVGHAVEAASGYEAYLHGEADSVGMIAAAVIAESLGLLDGVAVRRHADVLSAYQLPLTVDGLTKNEICEAMTHDKKRRDGRQNWVLLDGLANPVIRADVGDDSIKRALLEVGIA